jgi:hypothetical protein
MLGGAGYWNCGATFTVCSEVWGIEIVESLLLHARRCGVLKLWSYFYCMLGGVGHWNCGALLLYVRRCGVLKLWSHFYCMRGGVGYWNCGATFTACSEVWSLEIIIDIGRMYKNYSFVKIYYVDGKNIELHGLWWTAGTFSSQC